MRIIEARKVVVDKVKFEKGGVRIDFKALDGSASYTMFQRDQGNWEDNQQGDKTMPKTQKSERKQEERSAVQLSVLSRTFAKKLFPEWANDKEQMNVVEDFLYDLLRDNTDKTEDEIISDFEEQIEAAKVAYEGDFTPERAITLWEREVDATENE